MSELPMRGHFRYLRFKTFPMTPRTLQGEVFCPLLSSSKHSGVPKDSQPPTFPSVGLHPHTWPKWGCDNALHPQSVTSQGMCPNSFSSHYLFFFGLKTKSIKELRGASPNFSWDEGSQPTFPNPFDYAQLKHFPLPILLVLIVGYDHYPNPPPFLQHTFNFHLKSCVPPMGVNLPVKGKFIISIPVKHIIHPIQTFMIILAQYLPLFPLH